MAAQSVILLEEAGPTLRDRLGPGRRTNPIAAVGLGTSAGRRRDSATNQRRHVVAIVEDERELLSAYSVVFKSLGWDPGFTTATGEDIVKAVGRGLVTPDIVIMDYRLPGINGIEAGRRLLRKLPNTKVVITTADDSVRKQAAEAGLYFLQKPFSIATLVAFLGSI
jgi:CheY-like chemotaxis protein